MPSISYQRWVTSRARALDGIAHARAGMIGTRTARPYAVQQVNQAYALLIASQFQGFCRDLHSECVDHLVAVIAPPALQALVRAEFTRSRKLDQGNAQPSNLAVDFGRFAVDFWAKVDQHPRSAGARSLLDELNRWRNAIAHQDFDPAKLGGRTTLQLARVRRWRAACGRLAKVFDAVLRRHLQTLTGNWPW
jgi:hypothetical protein